jgi:hypothetical protein
MLTFVRPSTHVRLLLPLLRGRWAGPWDSDQDRHCEPSYWRHHRHQNRHRSGPDIYHGYTHLNRYSWNVRRDDWCGEMKVAGVFIIVSCLIPCFHAPRMGMRLHWIVRCLVLLMLRGLFYILYRRSCHNFLKSTFFAARTCTAS